MSANLPSYGGSSDVDVGWQASAVKSVMLQVRAEAS